VVVVVMFKSKIRHSKINIKNFLCKYNFCLYCKAALKWDHILLFSRPLQNVLEQTNTVAALNKPSCCSHSSGRSWPCCDAMSNLFLHSSALHHVTAGGLCDSQEIPSTLMTVFVLRACLPEMQNKE